MVILSHPTGNANVRHALQALSEAHLLKEFWTCIAWDENSLGSRVLPLPFSRQFARRTFPGVDKDRIKTVPWRETMRLLAPRLRLQTLTTHETGMYSIDAVYRHLDARVAKRLGQVPDLKAVYAYEDGASATFERAQQFGIQRLYDLPIGYWRVGQEIYAEEKERQPEWAVTLSGANDSAQKLERKDRELALAEHVFVASSYTRQTLQKAPFLTARVHVLSYGAPPASLDPPTTQMDSNKLKVLFVGALGQRKGLSYLLQAVDKLDRFVELTLVGQKPDVACAPLERAVGRHRWIASLPHHEILKEMGRHDVLVFPSLFEGFGLVLLEAMSQGVPIIATPHTAAPDFVEEGRQGFIVPIRSGEAIEEKLQVLLRDRVLLQDMKMEAWRKSQSFSWDAYHSQLQAMVKSIDVFPNEQT